MRWFLDTVRGQIIAIVIGTMLLTVAIISILLAFARPEMPPRPHGPWSDLLQIKAIVEAIQAASPQDRQRIAQAVSSDELRVQEGPSPACATPMTDPITQGLQMTLVNLLGSRVDTISVRQCAEEPGKRSFLVELPVAGSNLSIQINPRDVRPPIMILTMPLIVTVLFLFALVIALSAWSLWRISRPLRVLAGTVERFGQDVAITPLEVRGSLEIRQVTLAFNRMQERIARTLQERRRMLMAVGHDLRTPLTRLRLRIDMDETRPDRGKILRDLDLMQKLVDGALSYLNDQSHFEPHETVDLGALVESVCLEFAEAGCDVTYNSGYGHVCRCQPIAITRAVSNLIENGCRYGTRVVVDARCERQRAIIEVRDNGPGIPAAMQDTVLRPFSRLDPARAAEGRLGLGLSIVQDVVRRHAGELSLMDAAPSGLLVRITLPVNAEAVPGDARAALPQTASVHDC